MVRAKRTTRGVRRGLGRGACVACALIALPVAEARATITVANTNDTGVGSLRRAITDAAVGETIVVPAGTYSLTSGELVITKSLTIAGAGAADTIVRAGGPDRIFETSGGASTITLSGLTIRDGRVASPSGIAKGGGVWNQDATLTLDGVVVTNNQVDTNGTPSSTPGGIAYGGGVTNDSGSLTLMRSEISGNTASGKGGDNPGSSTGGPGGIVRGGGLYNTGTLAVTQTSFAQNETNAAGGRGGPGANGGPGGFADGSGAWVEPASRPARISSSTFSGNLGDSPGGAGGSGGGAFGPGGLSRGGGLFVSSSDGTIALANLTAAGNIARTSGSGTAQGGGVYAQTTSPAKVELSHASLSANTAVGTPTAAGGNLRPDARVELRSTILTGGVAAAGLENCAPGAVSLGHNLESRTPSQCGFSGALADKIGVDPLLGPLQANGGPTPTLALLAGSPAVDGGDGAQCPAADQRAVPRPQGPGCDIGAYERAPGAATTGSASAVQPTTATLGGTAANPDALAGEASVQYGTTPAYGATSAPRAVGPGAAAAGFEATVAGLSPSTTYHYRAVVTNATGAAFGVDRTFATPAAPSPPVITPTATVAPVLGPLKLSRRTVLPVGTGRASRPHGATLTYTDSQKAKMTLTVLRARRGVRVGRRCLARRPASAKGTPRRCTRYVRVGKLVHSDIAGKNRVRITGRVAGKPLPVGSFRLAAVARNAAGLASRKRLVSFRIRR